MNSHSPYPSVPPRPDDELIRSCRTYFEIMEKRRSLRFFSDHPVPKAAVEQILMTASTAPSGAHKQPWTFCAVSDHAIKRQIRLAAEEEEYRSYHGRMSAEWLRDLAPLGTDWHKPFLETTPWLIIVFRRIYEFGEGGKKQNNYYVNESVGIACGFLLAAIHQAGLVALTHTPSPMDFLTKVLNRPANEKPYLLIPIGYPAPDATVPDLIRKRSDEVIVWYE
ncbi:nitroreductase family protein [Cytophagaceae bacterium SJW1-29]|uniref:Nitroreductase family protein n=2 Tax=Salmonirosea aquatica TaxID=2654236 RepID=A0A7C9FZD2_9BACT|nr:nitroreductase family protein [Cytophagaceae bacterium SJW1-29]